MKIVSYDPKEVENIPAFFNKYLDEYKDEKYLMFIFNDILAAVKDKNEFGNRYKELLEKLDVPYAFFPYYIHFNRILNDTIRRPSPRISVALKRNSFQFDIVQEPAYGMMILNIEKLRSIQFKFNEKYKKSFYIQDLIQTCTKNGLYFSNMFFVDVHNSFDLFNSSFKDGFVIEAKAFLEEKNTYFKDNKPSDPEQINGYVAKLKEKYGMTTENTTAEMTKEQQ